MISDVKYVFEGKKYAVTGASSGIGKQITLEIAEAGGLVLAIGRNRERLSNITRMFPNQIITIESDVRDYQKIETSISNFVKHNGKLDGLVHAAGTLQMTPLKIYSEETARELMDIHFWSGIKLVQLINKKKYSNDGSSYVLISSVCAYKGEAAQFALNAAKISLQVSARTIAKEIYKKRNRINTVSPGLIMTELTKKDFDERGISSSVVDKHLLGLGNVEDVSGMVLYLLSDRARWITGQDFVVDGGYLVSD